MPVNCKMCGASNADNTQFCSACGTPLKDGAAPPQNQGQQQAQASTARARTVMFAKAPQIPTADAPKAAPVSNRTVLGAPAVNVATVKPAVAQAVPVAKPVTAVPPATTASNAAVATVKPAAAQPAPMIKMAVPKAAAPQPATDAAPKDNRARTVLGLPAATSDDIEAAVAAAKQKTAQTAATPSAPAEKPSPAPTASQTGEPARTTGEPKAAPEVKRQATPFLKKEEPSHGAHSDSDEWPDETEPRKTGPNVGFVIAIAAAALVILGLIAFIVAKFILFRTPDFQPQIQPAADGEHFTVILDLPDAGPGSTVQLQDKNIPVAGGKVQFLLPKNQMVLGANLVKLTLLEPNESPEEISFPITLRHMATNDFSELNQNPPTIGVHFQVAAGFSIKVNGTACQMSNNVCDYKLALPANATKDESIKQLQYTVPFELVDAEGNTDPGQHIISVPITAFQLDRPAEGAVVDTKEVTVSGSTVPGATVTVNGQQLTANDSGFSTSVPLPSIGTNKINIRVYAKGAAPVFKEVIITKVDNLRPYVNSWAKELDKKFDFAKLSRDTNVHTGKKIHLTGRIININTAKGVTAFLMYVDNGCPLGGQCGVYVAFRGETEAGLQSMVEVYGTVRGTQEVNFAGGKKKALPAIDAKYVLISEATAKKKKRRK